jgi:hypothetical protein
MIEAGEMEVTEATGGSVTTAIDTKLTGKGIGDSDYIDGFIAVIYAGSAAPEDEFSRISANADNGTNVTFTIDTLTTAIVSGDVFGYTLPTYPIYMLRELANAAMRMLGMINLVDTTTLDTASSKKEYTAEVVWKHKRPTMIDYQGKIGSSGVNDWVPFYDWEWVPATPGSTGKIITRQQLPGSRDLRIWYVDVHPRLTTYSSVISETVAPELAVKAMLLKMANWNLKRTGADDEDARSFINDAKRDYLITKIDYPIEKPRKQLGGLIVADGKKL